MWVLLWTLLVLISALLLTWLILRDVRRGMQVLEEIGQMGESMDAQWARAETLVSQRIRQAPVPGVLIPIRQAREDYLREKTSRQEKKVARRIRRRERLGQPQRYGDMRHGAEKGSY